MRQTSHSIVWIVLVVIIVLGLVFLPPPVSAASLSLSVQERPVRVNDTFQVDVLASGGEATLGTDVMIKFDPERLRVDEVKESTMYPTYNPTADKRIDSANGIITISGSSNMSKPIAAQGKVATLTVKALRSGIATIEVLYTPGMTQQSGIIDFYGNDLLQQKPTPLTISVAQRSIFSVIKEWISGVASWFTSLWRKN